LAAARDVHKRRVSKRSSTVSDIPMFFMRCWHRMQVLFHLHTVHIFCKYFKRRVRADDENELTRVRVRRGYGLIWVRVGRGTGWLGYDLDLVVGTSWLGYELA